MKTRSNFTVIGMAGLGFARFIRPEQSALSRFVAAGIFFYFGASYFLNLKFCPDNAAAPVLSDTPRTIILIA